MTIQLNVGDHVSPEPGYVALPPYRRPMAQWARSMALKIARDKPAADTYYRSLPNGRSLTDLLADGTIWVNYGPGLAGDGETNEVGGKEIAIGPNAFQMGRWTVLATLLHELAHSNGAPGGMSKSAEEALIPCGLGRASEQTTGVDDAKTPFDPAVNG
jgi:hypothetical protein